MTQLQILAGTVHRRKLRGFGRSVIAGFALCLLAACSSTFETRAINYKEVEVVQATEEIDESRLLGVRIQTFDPGELPESKDQARGLSKKIRKAEGFFIPVKLKDTMQGSGHWGPVRVVPAGSRDGEVVVSGKILESDGEILKVEVSAHDATGAKWYTKTYGGVVSAEIYEQTKSVGIDAFQYLYNQIANDLAIYRRRIPEQRVDEIRQVAELRFAKDFAPEFFSDYLKDGEAAEPPVKEAAASSPEIDSDVLDEFVTLVKSDDVSDSEVQDPQYAVERLPSKEDPMYLRVMRIRAREHLLIDTLDQQYDGFARNINDPYIQWRISRLTEMNSIREMESLRTKKVATAVAIGVVGVLAGAALGAANCYNCAIAGGVIAGAAVNTAFQRAMDASRQAEADSRIHKAALEEAGQSLSSEVEPIVMEVEGETVELTGTVEAKFQQWRDVIRQIHEREVGPIQDSSVADSPNDGANNGTVN